MSEKLCDIDLDLVTEEWVKGNFVENEDMMPHKGMQEKACYSDVNFLIVGGTRGGGKCLLSDSYVFLESGKTVLLSSLKIGDKIYSDDGKLYSVTGIYPQGMKKVFNVIFQDHRKTKCCEEHLWHVKERENWKVLDTKTMLAKGLIRGNDKKYTYRFKVAHNKPVQFEKKVLPINPWALGILIANGTLTTATPRIATTESFIIKRLESLFPEFEFNYDKHTVCNYNISDHNKIDGKCFDGVLDSGKEDAQRPNRMAEAIKELGLNKICYYKFIPKQYLHSTIEDRMELLRGLMDTDGSINTQGSAEYTTSSKQLARDVAYLCRSLGIKATISYDKRVGRKVFIRGEEANTRLTWRIYINTSEEIFSLPRKLERVKNKKVTSMQFEVPIIDIVETEEYADMTCITIDSPNNTFLTNDFVVTHNSYVLIQKALYHINNPRFRCKFFRKGLAELEDDDGLGDKCQMFFKHLDAVGTDKKKNWAFPSGATVKLDHLQDESKKVIEKRLKGLGIALIGVDEIDQINFSTLLLMMESNRNPYGIPCQVIGTCNPSKTSWIRMWIDWYIGDDGYIIKERDGAIRYFYVYGDSVQDVIWGESKEDVYQKARTYIDAAITDKLKERGVSVYDTIKSFQFIQGDLSENKELLDNDPNYLANIAQGSAEQVARNIKGNWNVTDDGDEMVLRRDIDNLFDTQMSKRTGVMRMTCDPALTGRDDAVFYIWDGNELIDVIVRSYLTPEQLRDIYKGLLFTYKISAHNSAFDKIGLGEILTEVEGAIAVDNRKKPEDETGFTNVRSRNLYKLASHLNEDNLKYSISPHLKYKKFPHGKDTGKGRKNETLYDILQSERRGLVMKNSNGVIEMLDKKGMKAILGFSPNHVDAFSIIESLNQEETAELQVEGLFYL